MLSDPLDLVLVRHALTDWNEQGRLLGRLPVPLNARGQRQAEAVATALRDVPLNTVISSPQLRAQETAEPVARKHGLTVRTDEALSEVWLGPRWEGKAFDEVHDDPEIARVLRDPTYRCEAAEPATDVKERVVGLVERLRREERGTLVLVSHGDPLRVLLAHYLSMPLTAFRSLVISNASVSVLRFVGSGAHLELLNWQPAEERGGWKSARRTPSRE
jgi:broad specificity phosphatase PhoE